jgi:hypothetical protein
MDMNVFETFHFVNRMHCGAYVESDYNLMAVCARVAFLPYAVQEQWQMERV